MSANTGTNHGFLTAEDAALKHRLGSLELSGTAVQVFYRHPEKTTEKTYPFVTIEMINLRHATDRQESERFFYHAVGMTPEQEGQYTSLDYYPSQQDKDDLDALTADGGFLRTESFVPVDLIYQVTTYTRSAREDRELQALLLRRVTPFRRGFIEIPEDGTMRRLDLMNWNSSDILDMESGYKKRTFRKVYTLSMSAEIPAADLTDINRVTSYVGTISDHNYLADDVLSSSFTEEF